MGAGGNPASASVELEDFFQFHKAPGFAVEYDAVDNASDLGQILELTTHLVLGIVEQQVTSPLTFRSRRDRNLL